MGLRTTGLVLPGGGARGAYQVGVLKAIAEMVSPSGTPFPVLTGMSVGAINAAMLATHSRSFAGGVQALERLWRGLSTSQVYRTDAASVLLNGLHWVVAMTPVAGLGVPAPQSLLDNAPLRDLLVQALDLSRVEAGIREGSLKALSITASSYDRGRAVTFFEAGPGVKDWRRARREGLATRLSIDHLMASIALPFVFPAQKIGTEHFGDGSLRLTSPLSPAIHTGADRLLVIAVRDMKPDAAPDARGVAYPSIGSISGTMLDIIFMDNLDADIERTERIDRTLSLVEPSRAGETALRDIEVLTLQPSRDLRSLAMEYADRMPWTIQLLMRRLGLWAKDGRLISYLMFEAAYCGALIELGYADTAARRDEVEAFLRG